MAQKDNFQKEVLEALQKNGFATLLAHNQHKQFIQMIAATFFTNQLQFEGIPDYLADVIDNQQQRKNIAQIMRDIKVSKIQKKPQPQAPQSIKDKQDKTQKKPEKKVKTEATTKPKQTKNQKKYQAKGQNEGQNLQNPQGEQATIVAGQRGERKNLKQQLQNSGKTKCRFFPFCKNPDSCEFYHPTEKCQYFPNCRYAENCLYVHQACRFKEKCTKLNCPFAHPGKRPTNPLQAFMKQMMGKNSAMFNKGNMKKKRPTQPDAKEEDHQEQ